jgi:ABC-type branched-subunit amino acid transport system substrate-binding protein
VRRPRPAAALLVLVLVATGCGDASDDDGSADGPGTATTAPDGSGERPAEVAGFDGSTIRVGVITDPSGSADAIADPTTAGSRAYFDALNAAGGVADRYEVELVEADGDPAATTADAAYQAIRDDVVLIAQILGTDTVADLLPRLVEDGMVASPASLDASWVHEQQLLPVGGPYQVQAANALTWYVEGGSGGSPDDDICALVRDDPDGDAGLEGFEAAADANDLELAEVVTFPAGESDFADEVDALDLAGCDLVLFVGLPAETSAALRRASRSTPPFAPQWIGQSSSWEGQLASSDLGSYLQEHLLVAGEGTEWGDTSVPGMAQLLEDAPAAQSPDLHFAFGYAQARAVHQVLEAAVAAGDLSRDGIRAAMASIEMLTFDGLIGNYKYGAPEDRDPPRASTIFAVDPAAPGGLRNLEADVISDVAQELEFD